MHHFIKVIAESNRNGVPAVVAAQVVNSGGTSKIVPLVVVVIVVAGDLEDFGCG